jgi:hypothetical protein
MGSFAIGFEFHCLFLPYVVAIKLPLSSLLPPVPLQSCLPLVTIVIIVIITHAV